jgi:transposase
VVDSFHAVSLANRALARELACDWHTVNDAVATYGRALLEADRKRMNQTSAIGLDETAFVKLGSKLTKDYATTVADVEHHQIIDILPSRNFVDVAGWLDKQPESWKQLIRFGTLDMSAPTWSVAPDHRIAAKDCLLTTRGGQVEAWAGGFAASLMIGAVAGLMPALRAARLSPTQAFWSV